jgi:hypothetical protein
VVRRAGVDACGQIRGSPQAVLCEHTFDIPFVNLTVQHVTLRDDLLEAVARVEVAEFEQQFADFCGVFRRRALHHR